MSEALRCSGRYESQPKPRVCCFNLGLELSVATGAGSQLSIRSWGETLATDAQITCSQPAVCPINRTRRLQVVTISRDSRTIEAVCWSQQHNPYLQPIGCFRKNCMTESAIYRCSMCNWKPLETARIVGSSPLRT